MTSQVPITDGLFTWPADDPRLLAARCTQCGNHMFPVQSGCSRCSSTAVETVELAGRGVLWTWTVQSYPPKSPPFAGDAHPDRFEPYGVGYIDIDGKLLVESRLTCADPALLEIGMEMDLVIEPLFVDDEGAEVMMFAVRPAREAEVAS